MMNIFKKKIVFKPYSKVDLVLLDQNCSRLSFDFLKCKTINSNEINIYHLFFSFLKYIFDFKLDKKLSQFYFIEIIKSLDPKIGLGCDIDYKICSFIKFFPQKISIIYQFSNQNFNYKETFSKKHIYKFFKKNKKIKCDYFFIWDKKYKEYFDFFDTKFIVNGSTRNNEVSTRIQKKIYDIMLISQFRYPVKSYYGTNRHYLSMRVQDATVSYVSKILENMRKKFKLKIAIALASGRLEKKNKINKNQEIDFFKRDIKSFTTSIMSSSELAEKSKVVICIHSTLGPELLSRGHKVLFLNPDHFFFDTNVVKKYDHSMYCNAFSEKVIIEKINQLIKVPYSTWKRKIKKNIFNIQFDEDNKILKNLIKNILNKTSR